MTSQPVDNLVSQKKNIKLFGDEDQGQARHYVMSGYSSPEQGSLIGCLTSEHRCYSNFQVRRSLSHVKPTNESSIPIQLPAETMAATYLLTCKGGLEYPSRGK